MNSYEIIQKIEQHADNCKLNEFFNEPISQDCFHEYICDICNKHNIEYCGRNNVNFNLCKDCYNNIENYLTFIDRLTFNRKEKPLIWKCDSCGIRMGGGYKWFYSQNLDIDICFECMTNKQLISINDLISSKYQIGNEGEIYILTKLNKDDYDHDFINNNLNLFTKDNLIPNLYRLKANSISDSLLGYELIDNLVNYHDAYVSLIVDLKKGNHSVYSYIMDGHGRSSIQLIYNTWDNYLKEYNEWNKSYNELLLTLQMNNESASTCESEDESEDESDDETENKLLLKTKHFSVYIIKKNKLPIYFG